MPQRPWPEGVEPRRRRPQDNDLGTAILGALVGAAIGGPSGAFIGGTAGLAAGTRKTTLEQAIRAECARRQVEVVAFERPARHRVAVTVLLHGKYWLLESTCPYAPQLEQEDLDDWLYGDFIENSLAHVAQRAG